MGCWCCFPYFLLCQTALPSKEFPQAMMSSVLPTPEQHKSPERTYPQQILKMVTVHCVIRESMLRIYFRLGNPNSSYATLHIRFHSGFTPEPLRTGREANYGSLCKMRNGVIARCGVLQFVRITGVRARSSRRNGCRPNTFFRL